MGRRASKSEDEIPERIKSMFGLDLKILESLHGCLLDTIRSIEIRQNDDLTFAVAMISGIGNLIRFTMGMRRSILMMGDKIVQ